MAMSDVVALEVMLRWKLHGGRAQCHCLRLILAKHG
jgi:hypothetical protein